MALLSPPHADRGRGDDRGTILTRRCACRGRVSTVRAAPAHTRPNHPQRLRTLARRVMVPILQPPCVVGWFLGEFTTAEPPLSRDGAQLRCKNADLCRPSAIGLGLSPIRHLNGSTAPPGRSHVESRASRRGRVLVRPHRLQVPRRWDSGRALSAVHRHRERKGRAREAYRVIWGFRLIGRVRRYRAPMSKQLLDLVAPLDAPSV